MVAEDLLRWEADLEKYPEYKAHMEARVKDRLTKQQERAAKKQILKAAKKRPTRPGKLGLPKPKPIVKNGKLTRGTRKATKTENGKIGKTGAATKRRRKVCLRYAPIAGDWLCLARGQSIEWIALISSRPHAACGKSLHKRSLPLECLGRFARSEHGVLSSRPSKLKRR